MATTKRAAAKNVDEYLREFPPAVRAKLQQIRQAIRKTAPTAEEMISYGIAGYKYHGMLIYFAGFKNHVSVYPAPRQHKDFKKELAAYGGGKGTVQFPLNKPVPLELVKKIVQFRMKANEDKAGVKRAIAKPTHSKRPLDTELVAAWMNKLEPKVKKEIETVRKIIRNSSVKLNERIKWNAPSYYYKEDILTFGPYRNNRILLVLHHPSVVKLRSALLEGDYKDRRLVYFSSGSEATKNKKELTRIINEIIGSIDKKSKTIKK